MFRKFLIIAALVLTSSQIFCQEEETPEKWKVTSIDTVSFKDYNFYKISLTEAKLTRYLVSRKENFVEADKTRYSPIKKGDFLDISIYPVEPAITMELTNASSPQSFKIKDHYITKKLPFRRSLKQSQFCTFWKQDILNLYRRGRVQLLL